MKKYCIFPDQTTVEIQLVLDVTDTHTYIFYLQDNIPQILWVPNDFIIKQ